jgi:aldose 1-epimerase
MGTTIESEIILSFESQRAVVSNFGASLRQFYISDPNGQELPILWGYQGTSNCQGAQGDVLAPFPGRLRNGAYRFGSDNLQMSLNDKAGPNAIHGFLRNVLWKVDEQTGSRVSLSYSIEPTSFKGYPFSVNFQILYTLTEIGLEIKYYIKNNSKAPAPVGIGFHPYFTVGHSLIDETSLQVPALKFIELNSTHLPTGEVCRVSSSGPDFRVMRPIGSYRFNHCFTDIIRDDLGFAQTVLENLAGSRRIIITMDRSFEFLVVYTGDELTSSAQRRAIAIEPMTCGTDAFNQDLYNAPSQWGDIFIQPQQLKTGQYRIAHEFVAEN